MYTPGEAVRTRHYWPLGDATSYAMSSDGFGGVHSPEPPVAPLRIPCVDDHRHTSILLLGSLKHCDRWFPFTLEEDFYKQDPFLAPALHKILGVESPGLMSSLAETSGCVLVEEDGGGA